MGAGARAGPARKQKNTQKKTQEPELQKQIIQLPGPAFFSSKNIVCFPISRGVLEADMEVNPTISLKYTVLGHLSTGHLSKSSLKSVKVAIKKVIV